MEFSDLGLPETVMLGIKECGFTTCTPIQEMTLPLTLAGRDVAGQAQTGTGKTAAFLVAAMSWIQSDRYRDLPTQSEKSRDRRPRIRGKPGARRGATSRGGASHGGEGAPRILVIAPTRELVVQIENDARSLGMHSGLNVLAVYGGVDYEKQRTALSSGKVDLLIGTPGRLIDFFKQKIYHCQKVQSLVIDEADRMFDMGFVADLRYLLRRLPPPEQRLSMLFSASLSYRAQELSYEHMNTPEVISTPMDVKTVHHVTQCLYHIEGDQKISLLGGLLRRDLADECGEEGGRVMLFVNTKRMGEKLQLWLEANGIISGYLSGDVPQSKRLRVLQRFQGGELPVLIATDVAGRGLHIDGVTHVINFDLPENPEDYLHRIGRTARAGAKGDAISLVDEEGVYRLEAIESYCGLKIYIAWAADDLLVELKRPKRSTTSGSAGRTKPAQFTKKYATKSGHSRSSLAQKGRSTAASQGQSIGSAAVTPSRRSKSASAGVAVPAKTALSEQVLASEQTAAPGKTATEPAKKKRRRRRRRSKKPQNLNTTSNPST